jgi:hypothetical protein
MQRADINIKSRFGKKGRQQLGVMVMAFFAHVTDQDPRPPPFPADKLFNSLFDYTGCHKYVPIARFANRRK